MRTSTKLKLAFGALAAVDTALAGSRHPKAHGYRRLTKPLLVPTLAASLVTNPEAADSPLRTTTLLAQAGGWAGDVILLSHSSKAFASGAGSFGLGHLAYIAGFTRLRDRRTPLTGATTTRGIAVTWALTAPVVAVAASKQEKVLGPALLGYSGVLASMVAAANHLDPALPHDARLLTGLGAALFMASDSALGARSFLLTDSPARLESAVMATYTAAQFLLAEGAARA